MLIRIGVKEGAILGDDVRSRLKDRSNCRLMVEVEFTPELRTSAI